MSIWRSLREVEHPAYLRDRPQRRFHGAQCQLSCHQGTRPPWLSLSGRPPLASSRHRRRTQSGNPRQDLTEHPLRHRDLRHLEGEIAAVADHLRTNLDQHFPQCGHRPVLELLQQCQCPSRVKTGSPAWASECPLLGAKRKSISGDWMSVHSQYRSNWPKSPCPGTCFGKS